MARLLAFTGLPGTGKSSLADALARHLRAPVFSVDPIEAAVVDAHIPQSFATGLAAYLVAEALADAHLALGFDVIVDAVNGVAAAHAMWDALATRHGAALAVIECVCSDEALHRARLEARRRPPRHREPTWADVVERRRELVPWHAPAVRVDAVDDVADNLARVLAALAAPA